MTAYVATNGDDTTAKLYDHQLPEDQLHIGGVLPYATPHAALAALESYAHKPGIPLGVIDLMVLTPQPVRRV